MRLFFGIILIYLTTCNEVETPLLQTELVDWEKQQVSKEYVDSAYAYFYKHEYEKAIEFFDSATNIYPTAEIFYRKGILSNRMGNLAMALEALDSAIALGSTNAIGERAYIKLYSLQDYENALFDFEEYIKQVNEPAFVHAKNVYQFIGLAHKQKGNYKKAIEYFTKEIELEKDPKWIDIYVLMYRGISYLESNQNDLALKDFDQMIQICPTCPEGYFYKAKMLIQKNQKENVCHLSKQSFNNKLRLRYWIYHEHIDQVYEEDIQELLNKYCENQI